MRKLLSKLGWYSFKEGILNLIRWFTVIWRDRDFDQNYLYRILYKKLEHMEKFFRSEWAYTASANDTADEIYEAKVIIYRLLHDTYFTERITGLKTEEIFSFEDGRFKTNREHPDYPIWNEASEQAEIDRRNDKKRLFEILNTKIDGWWD